MDGKSLSEIIIEKFGGKLYQQAVNLANNKVNIIFLRKDPIKIRSIILQNEREFHLIIDEEKGEIFHDCPSFLIHSEIEKKICTHFVKLLLVIKDKLALKILKDFDSMS